jgi:type IX secretion system PorP/SprF family membrane protein
MTEGMTINPAFAGHREVLSTSLFHRSNWLGFEGAPQYQMISAHTPLVNYKVGLGILIGHESYGPVDNTNLFVNYAYRMELASGKLALGMRGGFNFKNTSYQDIDISPRYSQDPAFTESYTSFLPNFGIGANYYAKRFFIGASIPTLLLEEQKKDGGGGLSFSPEALNYFVTTGFFLGDLKNFKIGPTALVAYRLDAPINWLANLYLQVWKFRLISGYASNKTFVNVFQIKANEQLTLGLGNDISMGDLSSVRNLSWEVMLRYEFRYLVKAANPIDF